MKKEIDIDKLSNDYAKKQGEYSKDALDHFKKGAEKVLKLAGNRLFTREDMIECFNSARKVYTFKNGMPKEVFNSAESYVNSIEKLK